MRCTSMPTWQVFGATVASLRRSHQLGLRAFARAIKMDPGYLSHIEHGKVPPPSDEVLMRMAELLEIPIQTSLIHAGRLPPETLLAFWQHPAIPPILSTLPGMTLPNAQTFCQQVLDSLPQPTTA
jgi:transcriptional regulator with XRE-family HTH domain